jgi:hypothetical protein
MVLYWAHRGSPATKAEIMEYYSTKSPSKKKIVRLFYGRVKLAVGVIDYWLEGRATYRKTHRRDWCARDTSAKPQIWLLDTCVPVYVWFYNLRKKL